MHSGIDTGGGTVPVAGSIFTILSKANPMRQGPIVPVVVAKTSPVGSSTVMLEKVRPVALGLIGSSPVMAPVVMLILTSQLMPEAESYTST